MSTLNGSFERKGSIRTSLEVATDSETTSSIPLEVHEKKEDECFGKFLNFKNKFYIKLPFVYVL